MNDVLGMFSTPRPRAMQGLIDAPYRMMGRHVLCAGGYAFDGGAAAYLSGRLRNAKELLEALKQGGVSPCGRQAEASALLLGAYRLWGQDFAAHIEGPASCVVIDQEAGKLLLSRDRMGETSLFYAARGNFVAFADAIAPILEAPGVSRAVDREGWCEVFGLGPARTPGRTPFRDIRALEPGCAMVADESGQRIFRYFALEARPHEDGERRTREAVRMMVERAVGDIAPLSPASMLSGGLDSTALTALLCERNGPVETFSVDYEGNADHFSIGNSYQPDQDAPWVEKAVRALNCRNIRVLLPIQALVDGLSPAMEGRCAPGMGDIDSSLMLFAREIARYRPCVLSGECGDEVFGGYPWFHRDALIEAEGFPWSGAVSLRESVLRPSVRGELNLPEYASRRYREACDNLPALPGEGGREARLRRLQGLCFQYFMPNLQERAANMCGLSGVKVLTPFCDDRLVQYVYNIPWKMKALFGHEKGILRAAMEGLLPADLLWRKKSPYPKTYHPEYKRLVIETLRGILSDPASPILQLADKEALEALTSGPLSPADTPWFGQLMAGPQMLAYLIQVNQWMLRFRVEVDL